MNNSKLESLSNADLIEPSSLIVSSAFQNTDLPPFSCITEDIIAQECETNKKDYLIMIIDIHNLLKNSTDLSYDQKLEYCNSERHYMKEYLKYTLIKVNKCFPD